MGNPEVPTLDWWHLSSKNRYELALERQKMRAAQIDAHKKNALAGFSWEVIENFEQPLFARNEKFSIPREELYEATKQHPELANQEDGELMKGWVVVGGDVKQGIVSLQKVCPLDKSNNQFVTLEADIPEVSLAHILVNP